MTSISSWSRITVFCMARLVGDAIWCWSVADWPIAAIKCKAGCAAEEHPCHGVGYPGRPPCRPGLVALAADAKQPQPGRRSGHPTRRWERRAHTTIPLPMFRRVEAISAVRGQASLIAVHKNSSAGDGFEPLDRRWCCAARCCYRNEPGGAGRRAPSRGGRLAHRAVHGAKQRNHNATGPRSHPRCSDSGGSSRRSSQAPHAPRRAWSSSVSSSWLRSLAKRLDLLGLLW